MLSQRLANCPPYEPGRGGNMAHQCPGARTSVLREPRFSEGNEKGSRKEEMDQEKGSRGEQRLCSFPLCSGSLLLASRSLACFLSSVTLGHSPSPTTLQSNFVPFLNSASGTSPLSVPLSKILLPSSLCDQLLPPLQAPVHPSPWQSDLPNDQPAQGVATTLSVHFPSHPQLCCPSPFLFCARMVSISLPSLEYELPEKIWLS